MARRFVSVGDVKRYLAHVLNELKAGTIQADDARVCGYVSGILHKVMLDAELLPRIEALEKALKRKRS